MRKARIAFLLPHLKTGGIEHVVSHLLSGLDRDRFTPLLFLRKNEGALLAGLGPDIAVHDAGGRRALLLGPALARWLAQQRVDLVYSGTNAMNIAVLLATLGRRGARRPRIIISEHTQAGAYLAASRHPRARRGLVRGLYPRADLLVAPTETLARDWIDTLGLHGLDHAVAPNPVLAPQVLAGLAHAAPPRIAGRVVAAGRLVAEKGHDTVIEAVARLAPAHPQLHLKIFGEGPDQARLAARIARLGLAERITLEGVTASLMPELAQAQVLALGSRREGFGNVLVEALAAGARVVASDCAGPRDILAGGRLGWLVPPGDVSAMAAALDAALRAPDDPAGRQAAARQMTAYLIPGAIRAFEDICDRLLGPAPARDGMCPGTQPAAVRDEAS